MNGVESVAVMANGKPTHQVPADDYEELVKIAQEHVSLLREIFKGDSDYRRYEKAWWAKRVCLSSEEALAVNCLEYRDGLVTTYKDGSVVTKGAFTIIYDSVKVYSSSNVVVDEFKIRDIKEMYHDERRGVLKIELTPVQGFELAAEDQAVLRSIYYNLLLRHPESNTSADPVSVAEAKVKRGIPTHVHPPEAHQPDLISTLALQQAQLEKLSLSVNHLQQRQPPAPLPAVPLPASSAYLDVSKRPFIHSARRAVVCNITYAGTLHAIPDGHKNLSNISDFLCARGFGGDKVMLTDSDPRAIPTKRNILKAMAWLVEGANPGDSLFLSICGHGGQKLGEGHGIPEGLCPADYQKVGVITGDEIRSVLQLPEGVRLTVVNELSQGGNILALPYNVVKGESYEALAGNLSYPYHGGTLLVVGCLKDGAGGRESITTAYCKAMNHLPEMTAAQLLSAMQQALTQYPTSPMISSYAPVPFDLPVSLGIQPATYVPSKGTDKDALAAYHSTEIGSWQPSRPLESSY